MATLQVRLWESENMALLQLAGGGGGAELLAFRTLSQRIKVHQLVSAEAAAAADDDGGGGGAATTSVRASLSARHSRSPTLSHAPSGGGGGGGGGGSSGGSSVAAGSVLPRLGSRRGDGEGEVVPVLGSTTGAAAGGGAAHTATTAASGVKPSTGTVSGGGGVGYGMGVGAEVLESGGTGVERRASSAAPRNSGTMLTKALTSKSISTGLFGKARTSGAHTAVPQHDGGAAGGGVGASGGGAGGGSDGMPPTEEAWPTGQRLPPTWRTLTKPGALVATLRAHPEGTRQLELSPTHRVLYSRGTSSPVKVWVPHAIVEESTYTPVARHVLPAGVSATGLCAGFGPFEGCLALGSTDGVVQALAADRIGAAEAQVWAHGLEESQGSMLSLTALGSGGAGGASGFGGGSSAPHSASPHSSLLLYTTEAGGAHAIDPRTGRTAWSLAHERPLGLMQCAASDAGANWAIFGSSSGHCVLWDLRYAIRLHAWQLPSGSGIRSMLPVRPAGSSRPTVLMGTDDHLVSGWELGGGARCTLLLQTADVSDAAADAAAASPLPPMSAPPRPLASGAGEVARSGSGAPQRNVAQRSAARHSVRALLAPLDGSCVLTASSDAQMRCWQLASGAAARSFTIGSAMRPLGGGGPVNSLRPSTTFYEHVATSGCRVVRELPVGHAATTVPNSAGGVAGVAGGGGPFPSVAAGIHQAGISSCGADDVGCVAAVTSAVYCNTAAHGMLFAGSLDGTIKAWR